ncbi:MAG: hypothetical protein ABR582_07215 [Gemmatimonadaceae bacterium]
MRTSIEHPIALANVVARLERRVTVLTRLTVGMSFAGLIGVMSAFVRPTNQPSLMGFAKDSVLVLRALSIVDSRGVERVRIAAPLPDPIMLGRRYERGDPVSGILIFDSEGNERGGYITDEERNAALTLDEINRAAIHIGTNDRGEAHFSLSNGRGGYAIFGMRPTGSFLALDGKNVATISDSAAAAR